MSNKKVSLKKTELASEGLGGAVWLLVGICRLFEDSIFNNRLGDAITLALFAGVVIINLFYILSGREKFDEMGINHIERARNNVLQIFMMLLIFIMALSVFIPINIALFSAGPIILGFLQIMTCCLFLHYEKVGI